MNIKYTELKNKSKMKVLPYIDLIVYECVIDVIVIVI